MSALCICYRCNSHLTMSESLEIWCLTCSDTAQLKPPRLNHPNETRPSRPTREKARR